MTESETVHTSTTSTESEANSDYRPDEAAPNPLTVASFQTERIDKPANVVEALAQAYATPIHTDTLKVQFGPGLGISEKIGSNGTAKISCPLPNGETLGKPLSIGLPTT